jgi:hypothetical protein
MANRTFLIQSDSQAPIPRNGAPTSALAAGSISIPVYWYSLFDESCVVANEVTLHDGRIEPYPYLVTPVSDARRRLSLRRSVLDRFIAESSKIVTEKWVQFVNSIDHPFLHLDAAELWMLIGPDHFRSHIRNCLQAYDQPLATGRPEENDLWWEMLDAAQIDVNGLGDTIAAHKLAGYSWGEQPVPWI